MKRINFKGTAILAIALMILSSCKKEEDNIFNMFHDVDVVYHNNSSKSLVDYREIEEGEEVEIDFTITSKGKGMRQVCVFEAGSATPTWKFNTTDAERYSYSNVITIKADAGRKSGLSTFRVWALDSAGVYMGDGYKEVSIFVKPNYNYFSNRFVNMPDADGNTKCFISLRTGEIFSYNEAKDKSDQIDAVLLYSPTAVSSTMGGFILYSLDASPLPLPASYSISSWTKRAVRFGSLKNSQTSAWLNNARNGLYLTSNTGSPSGKSVVLTRNSSNTQSTGTNLVFFKTPEGKAGALYVNYTTAHNGEPTTIVNVDIKVVK